jgi:hypothetical protein
MMQHRMPANPDQYWTRNRAYDVLAAVNEKGRRHERKLARPDDDDL